MAILNTSNLKYVMFQDDVTITFPDGKTFVLIAYTPIGISIAIEKLGTLTIAETTKALCTLKGKGNTSTMSPRDTVLIAHEVREVS